MCVTERGREKKEKKREAERYRDTLERESQSRVHEHPILS